MVCRNNAKIKNSLCIHCSHVFFIFSFPYQAKSTTNNPYRKSSVGADGTGEGGPSGAGAGGGTGGESGTGEGSGAGAGGGTGANSSGSTVGSPVRTSGGSGPTVVSPPGRGRAFGNAAAIGGRTGQAAVGGRTGQVNRGSVAAEAVRGGRQLANMAVLTYSSGPDPSFNLIRQMILNGQSWNTRVIRYEPYFESDALVEVQEGTGGREGMLIVRNNNEERWGLNLQGLDIPLPLQDFNHVVQETLGLQLQNNGITKLSSYADFLVLANDNNALEYSLSSSPGNMLVSLVPCVNNQVSPNLNRLGQPEIKRLPNGTKQYYDKFWPEHTSFYNKAAVNQDGTQNKLRLAEYAAFICEDLLHPSQLEGHRAAKDWFNQNGCGLGNDFVKLVAYDAYTNVIHGILCSEVCKMARLHGFWPALLFRNLLAVTSKWGKQGMQFTTVNRGARTSIVLVGFWRYRGNDRNQLDLIGIDCDGSFITIRD